MRHFVYLTTNLINGKQYIGDHSTNNLDDGYVGSGRPYFQRALKEYKRENFKRKILQFFHSKEEAFNAQEKYIKKYKTLYPNGYNISPKGGNGVKGCHSDETKNKISESNKGHIGYWLGKKRSEETKKKIGEKGKGRKLSIETINKIVNKRKNFKHSEESKIKISIANKGKTKGRTASEQTKQKMSESHKNKKRTPFSEETKKKMSESRKNYLNKKLTTS